MLSQRQAIIDALTEDTGRALLSQSEFDASLRRISYWSDKAAAFWAAESSGVSELAPAVRYQHQWAPLGLVGVIGPWNFPLLLVLMDALPALAAGCAVLAKPSEVTPRFVEPLARSVEAVPGLASVLRFLQGRADTGRALIDRVDGVCFTGSVATGRKVGAQAGERLIPAFLELGGKDPLVVLADADLDMAVTIAGLALRPVSGSFRLFWSWAARTR